MIGPGQTIARGLHPTLLTVWRERQEFIRRFGEKRWNRRQQTQWLGPRTPLGVLCALLWTARRGCRCVHPWATRERRWDEAVRAMAAMSCDVPFPKKVKWND